MTIIEFVTEMIRLLSEFRTNKSGKKDFIDWFFEFKRVVDKKIIDDEYRPF